MESGLFTVMAWNGKDLFLQAPDEHFIVLSRPELSGEMIDFLDRGHLVNRKIEITPGGELVIIKTPEEIENERQTRQRHARILRDIAALEADEKNLPPYAQVRLADLRKEIGEYERQDPTAVTLEQKRANASIAPLPQS